MFVGWFGLVLSVEFKKFYFYHLNECIDFFASSDTYIYIYIYILTQKYQAPSYTITSHQTVTDCSTTLVCSGGEVCGTLTCKQGYVLLVEMRIVADFYTSTSQGMH